MAVSYEKEMTEKAKTGSDVLITLDAQRRYAMTKGKRFVGGRTTLQGRGDGRIEKAIEKLVVAYFCKDTLPKPYEEIMSKLGV